MNCDIVIAHFNEDISWIKNLDRSNIRNIFLYTKSEIFILDDKLKSNSKILHQYLPNTGRESSTYLQYCIDKYDDLSDFVLFLQGNPGIHGVNSKKILSWLDIINKDNTYQYTKNFSISSIYMGLNKGRRNGWKGPTQPSNYDMRNWFNHYINKEINPNKARIYFGANFGLKKEGILSRSVELYQDIMVNELQHINPEACHYLERSWYYLFNMDLL